jgi:hypothetical protein
MKRLLLVGLLSMMARGAVLLDEAVQVPPGDWRPFRILLQQRPAEVRCSFAVLEGRAGVRLAILRATEYRRLRAGRRARLLVSTVFQRAGGFRYALPEPGEYVLIVDNRREMQAPAIVRLRVSVDFLPYPAARTLPAERRMAVVILSLTLFLAIVWWSGRRLLRAMREQKNRGSPPPYA